MQKNTIITVVVGLLVLSVVVIAVAKMQDNEQATNSQSSSTTSSNQEDNSMAEELQIEDIVVGEGEEAVTGKEVSVHYTGTLTDGTKFDSSVDSGTPFSFTIGAGEVIQGWDQGVAGMKVGGKRKLVIPAELGYGAQANGPIPANSTLIFEVELLEVY